MKHTVRGFTVVEILIVTAVIAIIAAISGWLQRFTGTSTQFGAHTNG